MAKRLPTTHGWNWRMRTSKNMSTMLTSSSRKTMNRQRKIPLWRVKPVVTTTFALKERMTLKWTKSRYYHPLGRGRERSRTEVRRRVRPEQTGKKKNMNWEALKWDAEIRDLLSSDSSENECEHPQGSKA